MKKVIRLTESDLTRIVKRIISEAVIAEDINMVVKELFNGVKPNEKGTISYTYTPGSGIYLINNTNNGRCIIKYESLAQTTVK